MDVDHQSDPTLRVYYSLIKVVKNRPAATVIGDFQSLGAWSLTSLAADVVAEIKRLEGKKEIGALYIAPPELISQCELIGQVPDIQAVFKECLRLEWTPTTLRNCAKRVSSQSRLFFFFILSSGKTYFVFDLIFFKQCPSYRLRSSLWHTERRC